jgi:hypothetical protein
MSAFCIPSIQAYLQQWLPSSTLSCPLNQIGIYNGDRLKLIGNEYEVWGAWEIDSYDSAYLELLTDSKDKKDFMFKALKEGQTDIVFSFKLNGKNCDYKICNLQHKVQVTINKDDPEARASAHWHVMPGCTYQALFCTVDDALDIQTRYPTLEYNKIGSFKRDCEIKISSNFPTDSLEKLKREKIIFFDQEVRANSLDDYDKIINTIPVSNRYSKSATIRAKVNEPLVITVEGGYPWCLGLAKKQKEYFSSIFELTHDESGSTSFILIPSKTTTEPLFFNVSWHKADITMVYPPGPGRTFSIKFAIEITDSEKLPAACIPFVPPAMTQKINEYYSNRDVAHK